MNVLVRMHRFGRHGNKRALWTHERTIGEGQVLQSDAEDKDCGIASSEWRGLALLCVKTDGR